MKQFEKTNSFKIIRNIYCEFFALLNMKYRGICCMSIFLFYIPAWSVANGKKGILIECLEVFDLRKQTLFCNCENSQLFFQTESYKLRKLPLFKRPLLFVGMSWSLCRYRGLSAVEYRDRNQDHRRRQLSLGNAIWSVTMCWPNRIRIRIRRIHNTPFHSTRIRMQ